MIALHPGLKLFVAAQPADMRKGFNGLHGLVIEQLKADPLSGQLFLFFNRRRDRLKIFYWDQDGLAIWYKRLESGSFQLPAFDEGETKISIQCDELVMLLSGVDTADLKRRKRYSLSA
jgi:transposase